MIMILRLPIAPKNQDMQQVAQRDTDVGSHNRQAQDEMSQLTLRFPCGAACIDDVCQAGGFHGHFWTARRLIIQDAA